MSNKLERSRALLPNWFDIGTAGETRGFSQYIACQLDALPLYEESLQHGVEFTNSNGVTSRYSKIAGPTGIERSNRLYEPLPSIFKDAYSSNEGVTQNYWTPHKNTYNGQDTVRQGSSGAQSYLYQSAPQGSDSPADLGSKPYGYAVTGLAKVSASFPQKINPYQ